MKNFLFLAMLASVVPALAADLQTASVAINQLGLDLLPRAGAPTENALKSGLPTRLPMIGVMTSFTSEVTTVPKAPPMMTPTAKSRTLPRRIKSLNPFNISFTFQSNLRLIASIVERALRRSRIAKATSVSVGFGILELVHSQ